MAIKAVLDTLEEAPEHLKAEYKQGGDGKLYAILDGLDWLGLGSDQPPVYQFSRAARHARCSALPCSMA